MAELNFETEATAGTPGGEAPHEMPQVPSALAVSVDDFAALEERIRRAVETVRQERQARLAAEDRAAQAEAQLKAQKAVVEPLQNEVNTLRAERTEVRQRVERLLAQLDTLEL